MGLRKYKAGQICVHRLKIARSVREKICENTDWKIQTFFIHTTKVQYCAFFRRIWTFYCLAQFTVYTVCKLITVNPN